MLLLWYFENEPVPLCRLFKRSAGVGFNELSVENCSSLFYLMAGGKSRWE